MLVVFEGPLSRFRQQSGNIFFPFLFLILEGHLQQFKGELVSYLTLTTVKKNKDQRCVGVFSFGC